MHGMAKKKDCSLIHNNILIYFIQDVGSEVADDRCRQSDKAVKLSALKLQIELTNGDILAIGTISL